MLTLPRVTTETGTTIGGAVTEEIHARNLLTLYLDQFTRGWSFTAVYLLRDRSDEGGNQQFGFYKPDYRPRKAAVYLHNLTTNLADPVSTRTPTKSPGKLAYAIPDPPDTVHDLLLQKRDGTVCTCRLERARDGFGSRHDSSGQDVPHRARVRSHGRHGANSNRAQRRLAPAELERSSPGPRTFLPVR